MCKANSRHCSDLSLRLNVSACSQKEFHDSVVAMVGCGNELSGASLHERKSKRTCQDQEIKRERKEKYFEEW